ncbi:hypothetical protein J1614_010822 [Plenodomus biglobosus]|nr:hypothetical protein J1614_010822 [Plenodomus biglobosus]
MKNGSTCRTNKGISRIRKSGRLELIPKQVKRPLRHLEVLIDASNKDWIEYTFIVTQSNPMRVPTASTPAGLLLRSALEWANMRSQDEDQTPCIRRQGWYHGAEKADAIHGSGGVNTPRRATRCESQVIYCTTTPANEFTVGAY